MIPGEYVLRSDAVTCNAGMAALSIKVINRGDRPIQVGSHYHFAEVNDALEFDRHGAYGRRLDIPAGTAVRFEPGDAKTVNLIELSGTRQVHGFRDRVNGPLDAPATETNAEKDAAT